jgi:hypothetical protein
LLCGLAMRACKEILGLSDYGRSCFLVSRGGKEEPGDVYYTLWALALCIGVNPDDALQKSLEEYTKRIERGENPGSGVPNAKSS